MNPGASPAPRRLRLVLKDNPANRACCIDQAMPAMGETFPQLDLLFQTRPSGVSYDIGAFELKQP